MKGNDNPTADDESIPDNVQADVDTDAPDEMTEQIEASFGPMSVYVSGTDSESVQETFEDVWETVMETYNRTHEMKQEQDDDNSPTGKTFGD